MHTVEVLDLRIGNYWNLINVTAVCGCAIPVFCPIDKTRIVIIGGSESNDVNVFDSAQLIADPVIPNCGMKLLCNDQSAMVEEGTTVSFCQSPSIDNRPFMVCYSLEENIIETIFD